MKYAIASDIHDNIPNLEKFLSWIKNNGAEGVICCGDVTTKETIRLLSLSFSGLIYLVRGNMEIYEDSDLKKLNNVKFIGRLGIVDIDGRKIGICHEPFLFARIYEIGTCETIFYGHTHKPWIEEKNKIRLVNPGTLGGVFQKSTFAVWDSVNNGLELKILEIL